MASATNHKHRVTISDEAKFRIQPFTLLSIGSRVVTFGKKVVTFTGKFEICYFCYDSTKNG